MYDQIYKMKVQIEFMNMGIVPLGGARGLGAATHHDINKILAELPPDEARKMKRKFRKIWRQIVNRTASRGGRIGRREAAGNGLGSPTPCKNHKIRRKSTVCAAVIRKIAKEQSL